MVDGVQGIYVPVSTGIISQRPVKQPNQIIRDRMEQRRIVREEMRYDELKKKAKTGELSKEENFELALLQAGRVLDGLKEHPPVCYIA